jgi:hypothetical protein
MAKASTLRSTDLDDVYTNEKGVHVDRNGVALDFKKLKKRDADQRKEVLGHEVREPHEFLKAVSLDPRYPLSIRMDAAKAAAPYFAAKKLDQGGSTIPADEAAARIAQACREADQSVGVGRAMK